MRHNDNHIGSQGESFAGEDSAISTISFTINGGPAVGPGIARISIVCPSILTTPASVDGQLLLLQVDRFF